MMPFSRSFFGNFKSDQSFHLVHDTKSRVPMIILSIKEAGILFFTSMGPWEAAAWFSKEGFLGALCVKPSSRMIWIRELSVKFKYGHRWARGVQGLDPTHQAKF